MWHKYKLAANKKNMHNLAILVYPTHSTVRFSKVKNKISHTFLHTPYTQYKHQLPHDMLTRCTSSPNISK